MEKFLTDIAPFGKVKTLNFHEDVFPSGTVEEEEEETIFFL